MIEGPDGSAWDATAGPRFDHLGYWSADLAGDRQKLIEQGAPLDFDACPYGSRFSYQERTITPLHPQPQPQPS